MLLQCLGSGDAFGSAGRLNTSFFIRHKGQGILLDCGATTMVALKRVGLSSSDVDVILISHLHGDHIGGIPFILTERQVKGNEDQELLLIGPRGLAHLVNSITHGLFPGITENLRYSVRWIEFETGDTIEEAGFVISTYGAKHAPLTNPHSLRLALDEKVIAYSGDTEWNENLIEVSAGADVFICEGYGFNAPESHHMSIKELIRQRSRISAKRIVLTHLSQEALDSSSEIPFEIAQDGKVLINPSNVSHAS